MNKNMKKCVWCGTEFYAPPSSKKITCSPECSNKNKTRSHTGIKLSDSTRAKMSNSARLRTDFSNLKNGTKAAMLSPKAGRSDQNSSAKLWKIISPDGIIYEFSNLSEWIRNNISLFNEELNDKNVYRLCHGFYTAKRNMLGKGQNPNTVTYKGWSILYSSEEKQCYMKKKERKDEKGN